MNAATGKSAFAYPSPLTETHIRTPLLESQVTLPCNELFRIDHLFNQREYEVPSRFLPTEPIVVVDVGANVGLFALYLKSVRPDSTIHCFEPAPHTLELLKANIDPLSGVHIHPFGLSDRDGVVSMVLHPSNTGENSIKVAGYDPSQCIDIPIAAAEGAFAKLGLGYVDILKIDTEGCEVEILQSLEHRLNYVGVILVEYHSDRDRRKIDNILNNFKIFSAKVVNTELGTLKYINRQLL